MYIFVIILLAGLCLFLWLRSERYAIKASAAEEKARSLEKAQEKTEEAFRLLSLEALQKNNEVFLSLAKTSMETFHDKARGELDKKQLAIEEMVAPVKQLMAKVETKIGDLEKDRHAVQAIWKEQLRALLESERQLRFETANLVKALRAPAARGRWGEIQLRRVVELAGMIAYCDFYEQQQETSDESRLRPDLLSAFQAGGRSLSMPRHL